MAFHSIQIPHHVFKSFEVLSQCLFGNAVVGPNRKHYQIASFRDVAALFCDRSYGARMSTQTYRRCIRRITVSFLSGHCRKPSIILTKIAMSILREPLIKPDSKDHIAYLVDKFYEACGFLLAAIIIGNYRRNSINDDIVKDYDSYFLHKSEYYRSLHRNGDIDFAKTSVRGYETVVQMISTISLE